MTTIRSLWSAVTIPGAPEPYATAHLKVHYPALVTGSDTERLSGVFQADPAGGPYPVVLVLSGINVGQDAYRWLAVELARQGFVTVTYDWVGPLFAGQVGITPGVDLALARPDTYGDGPTCQAIAPLLHELASLNAAEGRCAAPSTSTGWRCSGTPPAAPSRCSRGASSRRCGRSRPTARTPWSPPCSAGPRATSPTRSSNRRCCSSRAPRTASSPRPPTATAPRPTGRTIRSTARSTRR
ncbi:alpha/beta hydrolase [Dactylosporangium cerinum]